MASTTPTVEIKSLAAHAVMAPMGGTSRRSSFFTLLILIALIFLAGGIFAARQTLWLDETTQLSGLALGPVGVTRWLAGAPHDFGWPTAPDRMPPVSYWLGQGWAAVFGASEISLRWLGVVCTALAGVLIAMTARRAFGARAALTAGLFVALSPAVLEKSVEIRAYPLYLLTSAGAFFCAIAFLGRVFSRDFSKREANLRVEVGLESPDLCKTEMASTRKGQPVALYGLVFCLLLGIYTHFIGVLCAGSVLAALFWVAWREHKNLKSIFLAAFVTGFCSLGIYPFVAASVGVSEHGAHWLMSNRLSALTELLWNLFSHRVMVSSVWLADLVLLCMPAAIAAVIVSRPRGRDFASVVWRFIVAALLMGGMAIIGATFLFNAFKPAQYQYNMWMVPGVALLIGAVMRESSGISLFSIRGLLARWPQGVVMLLLILGAVGVARIAWLGPNIAHGPDPLVVSTLRSVGPAEATVVYDVGSEFSAVQTYYPLCYLFHGAVKQYEFSPLRNAFGRFDHDSEGFEPADASTPTLIIVRSEALKMEDLLASEPRAFLEGRAVREVEASGRWKLQKRHVYQGILRAETWVYQRVEGR